MPNNPVEAFFRRAVLLTAALVLLVYSFASAESNEVKIQDIKLDVPESWEQQPPANRLRLAQFELPTTEGDEAKPELVISFFGGGAGGVDANIQRWIGQFAGEGRTAKVKKGSSEQGDYYLVDIAGTYNQSVGPPFLRQTKAVPGSRMIGVILQVKDTGNYFLKLTGPDESVAAAADDLRKSFGANADTEKAHELN
ncbi:hypothetical protein [Stratiformator vulcanicus]|uniref:PsbP C-terminal domain-containing protein n=1 Tax=Stratiformator vulcanicus TaxID=2527980 RepID=A0A517QZX9_9PLAN|nr:hypothetical protein [Stratiformator vulcanicus]QDT37206.1 hypothetical protein Pan189_15780 [Stratiformator vulcanicus]